MKEPWELNVTNYRLAASVLLFNPLSEVAGLISALAAQAGHVILVDNSSPSFDLSADIQKLIRQTFVTYLSMEGNKGVGAALNYACFTARKMGFNYLVTLDQDDVLSVDFVNEMVNAASRLSAPFGIAAPRYHTVKKKAGGSIERIQFTQTAGNLLNLEAHEDVGGFLEELFVDHVDHEFCLRLQKHGYAILRMNDVSLIHRPGKRHEISVFAGRPISVFRHAPVRSYYFVRNGCYVTFLHGRLFPRFAFYFLGSLLKLVIRIFMGKDRRIHAKMVWLGFTDFRRRNFGPASELITTQTGA